MRLQIAPYCENHYITLRFVRGDRPSPDMDDAIQDTALRAESGNREIAWATDSRDRTTHLKKLCEVVTEMRPMSRTPAQIDLRDHYLCEPKRCPHARVLSRMRKGKRADEIPDVPGIVE